MGQVYDCVTFRDWRQSASLNMRPPALRGGQPLADDRRPLKPEARRPLYHRQQKKTQKRTKKKEEKKESNEKEGGKKHRSTPACLHFSSHLFFSSSSSSSFSFFLFVQFSSSSDTSECVGQPLMEDDDHGRCSLS